ncbi:Band 7 protein [Candidatus Magnetobacterium bavaricum]|uniref:Band 7 protein n=1 Tax=Candidatus Magnetobacterium bavaricum TaxID=29290 RepID=A0A0F3GJ29_9BACT|nr:Band 7 protein [Candidatus Magnetobacterium bavaricum]
MSNIGPTEAGLVMRRFSFKRLSEDNPVAFSGEAGYQSELLMPGWRFKLWIVYKVTRHPWVQVPAGEIGVVIAQVGKPLPVGAKSAIYKDAFGNFGNLDDFVNNGGQKGVQRHVLSPGTLAPIHPAGFLVITRKVVYGVPVAPEMQRIMPLTPDKFGLKPDQLNVVRIEPLMHDDQITDTIGIVTTYEGDPLPSGDIASRIGGFSDITALESTDTSDPELMETILASKNDIHNNYQNFQAFLDSGGKIGLQHDPLLYGAYNLNPFLMSTEMVPMLVVEQGQVAVVKSYVGLPSVDISGDAFKFGSIVRPGHRGIWREPMRTGKYPLNPYCYKPEIVTTSILNLNWAEATSAAHTLDKNLQSIVAKSKEGFIFKIDLQVQIHIPDSQAPKVISMVGSESNLVNEVLQAAVGNHFRDTLQALSAVSFIETRNAIQVQATQYIEEKLHEYNVETRGVYIQDVELPKDLVVVLTQREIANQEIETYKKQQAAQTQRVDTEKAKGTADMQAELAKAQVGVDIETNRARQVTIQADAAKYKKTAEGDGESYYIEKTGTAKGAEIRAVGIARAEAAEQLKNAVGQSGTTLVNAIDALMKGDKKIVPETMVIGGNLGSIDGLAASLIKFLGSKELK